MNPFTPSFGVLPVQFAGRVNILTEVGAALKSGGNSPALTSLFVGPRGCGKTCLLSYFEKEAAACGWMSANVFCMPGLLESIKTEAYRNAEHLHDKKKFNISEMQIKLSAGIIEGQATLQRDTDHVTWRAEMTDFIEKIEEAGSGLLITIDEVNPKIEELVQFISVYQMWIREGRKVALLMAGLPHRISGLINNESVTFLRRAFRYDIGKIEDYEIKNALSLTFKYGGKSISDENIDIAVKAIGGQPFVLQLVGYRAYQAAGEKKTISHDDIASGIDMARHDYVYGVLKPTIDSLTEAETGVLKAMLQDEEYSSAAELNRRLDKSPAYMNVYGPRLLDQGVVEKVGKNYRYALPMMREYLLSITES